MTQKRSSPARDAVIAILREEGIGAADAPELADRLLGLLWERGFKIVALERPPDEGKAA